MAINAEQLAYWYLRLNGFLTIPNFVVHPERGSGQRTDADILGVRFPYRVENFEKPMRDALRFTRVHDKSFIAIAEVKGGNNGYCKINGAWKNRERRNVLLVLCAIGAFTRAESDIVAEALYDKGMYTNQLYHISLLCFGNLENTELLAEYPRVPQILFGEVLHFVFERFSEYKAQKKDHDQWDEAGKGLWKAFEDSNNNEQQFISQVRV